MHVYLQDSDLLYEVEVPGPPSVMQLYGNDGGEKTYQDSVFVILGYYHGVILLTMLVCFNEICMKGMMENVMMI